MRARIILGALVTSGVVACGNAALSQRVTSTPAVGGAYASATGSLATPLPTAVPTPAHLAELARYRLWVESGEPQSATLDRVDPSTGKPAVTLQGAGLAPDWSRVFALEQQSGFMRLRSLSVATGGELAHLDLTGSWELPTSSLYAIPDPVAVGGRFLTLVGRQVTTPDSRPGASSFLVIDSALRTAPVRIDLSGDFLFDGLSADGRWLYLLENVAAPGADLEYHVRRYDVRGHALAPGVIADKASNETSMTGTPLGRTTTPDGRWQLTAYAFGNNGPFVHALDLIDGSAVCIDLPRGAGDASAELDLLWSLVQSPDHEHVYAVNGGTEGILDIGLNGAPSVVRRVDPPLPSASASPASTGWFATPVEAKRQVTAGAVVSADGRTLYAVADRGVVAIDTASLRLTAKLAGDLQPSSLALSPDGRWMFIIDLTGSASVVAVELSTGAEHGVPVAGTPYALFKAEAATAG